MTPAVTSRDNGEATAPAPVRVVIVTLDRHLGSLVARASATLAREIPGVSVALHAATDWQDNPEALAACLGDIAQGDIVIATMLFMDDHIRAVLPALRARREHCDAMIGALSAGEVVRLTKLGPLNMDGSSKGPLALLKKLRGSKTSTSGAGQMAVLRRLPKILKFIPGAAQDLRAYFLTMQYWLSGSEDNVCAMVRFLVGRYAAGPRRALNGKVQAAEPREYPDVGLYHPRAPGRIATNIHDLPGAGRAHRPSRRVDPALLCAGRGRGSL